MEGDFMAVILWFHDKSSSRNPAIRTEMRGVTRVRYIRVYEKVYCMTKSWEPNASAEGVHQMSGRYLRGNQSISKNSTFEHI
jgi:hypothetical protein